MRTVDDILEQAKRLPADDRRRLIEELEESVQADDSAERDERANALARWISRAGTGHSDHADVARNKYKHLAEIYADKK